jgi:hypothetical protein
MSAYLQAARANAVRQIANVHTIHDLHVLYEAYLAVEDVLLGFTNQPRCEGAASREIDRLSTGVAELRYAVLEKIRTLTPRNETEALKRAETLSAYFFSSGGDDADELQHIVDSLRRYEQAAKAA